MTVEKKDLGKRIIDISQLVDVFEAQEGEIQQIIGKTGNGKTYEATRRALDYLKKGYVVYTTWRLILPDIYDERKDREKLFWRIIFFWKKRFYVFKYKDNWKFLDIDRPDLIEFVAGLTDCIVFLDEGQDIFDSYEGIGMSKTKRKSLTRTRHLRKTLIIISQRAQAVAVTARANVTFFYKCVKTYAWYWPFKTYFKVYRTEEMDNSNFPIWEDLMSGWKAELWRSHFARTEVYNAYNSWYLRAGIPKSQTVSFDAYDLNILDKITAFIITVFTKPSKPKYDLEALMEQNRKKHEEYTTIEPPKGKKIITPEETNDNPRPEPLPEVKKRGRPRKSITSITKDDVPKLSTVYPQSPPERRLLVRHIPPDEVE